MPQDKRTNLMRNKMDIIILNEMEKDNICENTFNKLRNPEIVMI